MLRVIETKLKAFIDDVNKAEVENKAELFQAPIGLVKAGSKVKADEEQAENYEKALWLACRC